MEHGYLRGVPEVGWDALEPRVMRPARSAFARVVETALRLTEHEATLVAQCVDETAEVRLARHERRLRDATDIATLDERSKRRRERLAMRRARSAAPDDAWRRLVPEGTAEPLARSFAGVLIERGGLAPPRALHAWGAWNVEPHPTTLAPVLRLAADVDGMVAAEALARDASRRLEKMGAPHVTRVTWFVEHEPRLVAFRDAWGIREHVDVKLGVRDERLTAGEVVTGIPRNPADDAWRFEWLRLAKRDLVRANVWNECTKVLRLDENPFEPMLDVWRLGYGLVDIVDDAVVLGAESPPLDDLLDVLV